MTPRKPRCRRVPQGSENGFLKVIGSNEGLLALRGIGRRAAAAFGAPLEDGEQEAYAAAVSLVVRNCPSGRLFYLVERRLLGLRSRLRCYCEGKRPASLDPWSRGVVRPGPGKPLTDSQFRTLCELSASPMGSALERARRLALLCCPKCKAPGSWVTISKDTKVRDHPDKRVADHRRDGTRRERIKAADAQAWKCSRASCGWVGYDPDVATYRAVDETSLDVLVNETSGYVEADRIEEELIRYVEAGRRMESRP